MKLQNNILKIKRELGDFDKVKFVFRYIGINRKECELIEKELSNLTLKTNRIEDNTFVITFPLTTEIKSEQIKNLNKRIELSSSKYGIFVAFTTKYDQAGFRLPQEIRDFYTIVGGEFDCSIIMI